MCLLLFLVQGVLCHIGKDNSLLENNHKQILLIPLHEKLDTFVTYFDLSCNADVETTRTSGPKVPNPVIVFLMVDPIASLSS